jgi:hypothetical protein
MKKKIKRTTPEPIRIIKQLSSNIAEEKKKVELQKKKKNINFKKREKTKHF